MPATIALSAEPATLGLYSFLRDIDPGRYRRDMADRMIARVRELATEFERLAEEHSQHERLHSALARIAVLMREAIEPKQDDTTAHFRTLRAELSPAYEDLARELRGHAIPVPTLRATNVPRTVFHVIMAMTAVAIVEFLPATSRWIALGFFSLAVLLESSRRIYPPANQVMMRVLGRIAHPHEAYKINSSSWYTMALVVLGFGFTTPVCAVALTVLGFADPAAGVIRRRFGKTKLVHGRSLEGTLAFFVIGAITALAVLRIFHPDIAMMTSVKAAGAAALVGGIAELLAKRLDDNFAVPVAAAIGAWLVLG